MGANLSAHQLATMLTDPKSASDFSAPDFAFSEVPAAVQRQFLEGMGVDQAQASAVADQLSKLSGYKLSLAA